LNTVFVIEIGLPGHAVVITGKSVSEAMEAILI